MGEPLDHPDAAVSIIPGFQCALGTGTPQHLPQALDLRRLHGKIHENFPITAYIAACRADKAIETVGKQRFRHAQVAAGAQKHLVAVGPGLPDGLHGTGRNGHLTGRQQSTVNIQKNQFLLHSFLTLSLPVHGKAANQQTHG